MSDRPLFADGWYRPPATQELRHEFQNIYLLLRYILEKQRELEDARTEAVNLLDVATGSPLSYELQEGDTGTVFALYAEAGVTVVVPGTLPPGFTCGFVGFSLNGLTLDYDGWDPPVGWLAGAAAFANVPFAVTLAITEDENPFSALVLVGGSAKPDTVTVVYDSGWPVARPYATHVIAIGHSSAPSWLTSADVWLEAV